jgi:hypothetical protein
MPADALRLAKLAIAAEVSNSAEPLVTAARAYKMLGQPQNAADAARLAVQRGTTVGYEVLASVARSVGGAEERANTRARLAMTSDLLMRIELADRVRYFGVARTRTEIVGMALQQQRAKMSGTSQKTKQLAQDAADAMQLVVQQQGAKFAATSESTLTVARDVIEATRKRGHDD